MTRIRIEQGEPGWVKVLFPYDPVLVDKIKTVPGRQYNYDEKYWSVPFSERIESQLANLFSPEDVGIDPRLKNVEEMPKTVESSKGTVLARLENQLRLRGYVKRPAKYINGTCRSFLSFLIKNLKI